MTGQPSASPIWFQSFHCDGEDSHDFVPMKHQSSVLLFATASARHVTLRTDRRIHGLQNENGFVYHLPEKKVQFSRDGSSVTADTRTRREYCVHANRKRAQMEPRFYVVAASTEYLQPHIAG